MMTFSHPSPPASNPWCFRYLTWPITLGSMGNGEKSSGVDGSDLSLNEAIRGLRRELLAARDEADEDLALEVDEIELRLTLEASASGTVEGGVSFWKVVSGKVSAAAEGKAVHEVTLKLRPTVPGATPNNRDGLALNDRRDGR